MHKLLAITITIVILLFAQFVSVSAIAQTSESGTYHEAVRTGKKSEGATKAQAYQDAVTRNDFTDFCYDYPDHSKCPNAIRKAEQAKTKEMIKTSFKILGVVFAIGLLGIFFFKTYRANQKQNSQQLPSGCLLILVGFIIMWVTGAITGGVIGGISLGVFIIGLALLILGIIIWIADTIQNDADMKQKRQTRAKDLKRSIRKDFPQAKFHISYYDPKDSFFLQMAKPKDIKEAQIKTNYDTSFLAIDFEKKQIVVGIQEARESPPEQPYKMSFAFSDIVQAEIVRDGTQIATTNRGSQIIGAAVGAIALGGVGAVIGGLSASKTTLSGANHIAIRITVDNINKPIHEVTFYTSKDKKGGKRGEKLFDYAVQKAAEFGAHLDTVIRTTEKEQKKQPESIRLENNQSSDVSDVRENGNKQSEQIESSQNTPVSEQITQLWQLKQEGALTQEEFEKQKAKLLQS